MKRLIVFIAVITGMLAMLPACSDDAPDGAHGHPHDEAPAPSAAATNRVEIPANVRSNLGITFAKVERRPVANTIRVPGAFELQPRARHEYRLALPGRVEFLVEQFAKVEPGSPLYRYRSPEWAEMQHEIITGEQELASSSAKIDVALAALEEARTKLTSMEQRVSALAEAQFKRADLEAQLAEARAAVPRLEAEIRLAQTERDNAQRTIEHALHRAASAIGVSEPSLIEPVPHDGATAPRYRTIDWIEVKATEPGLVERLAITDGSYAESPSLVLSTVDPTKVRFRAMGLQSDLALFTAGQSARIIPPRLPGVDVAAGVKAKLQIGLDADPAQRTITLLATPAEIEPWIRPGVSGFLEVVTEATAAPVLAIPRSAVVKDGITHVFFRRDPANANQAIRVEADLGVDDGRWVEVCSGVMLGDEVVLDGVYELKLATAQSGTTQKGGHFDADGTFHTEQH
jgi:hypothetical protein